MVCHYNPFGWPIDACDWVVWRHPKVIGGKWHHSARTHGDWLNQGQLTLCVDWLAVALAPIVVIGRSQSCVGPWSDFACTLPVS